MKTTAALGLALLLATATSVRAQDKQADPAPSKAAKAADKPTDVEAEEEAEAVRGVRYRVELKSGGVLDGVIRAKGVFERRARGGNYEPADENDADGGVRIWFPSRQDGFIFLPISAIDRLDELGSLSVDEGKSLSRARVDAKRRAEGERAEIRAARMAAERAAQEKAAGEDESGDAPLEPAAGDEPVAEQSEADAADAAAKAEDEAHLASLLIKYPPTRWSPDSPDEIERRKVVLGLFPSDEETAFLETYDDWLAAYNAWLETNGKEAVAEKRPAKAKRPQRRSPRARPDVKRPKTPSWRDDER